MISEKQKLAIVSLSVLLVGEVIAVISIGLIYFNREFFGSHLDIIRTFVNASTAFFGCFFSFLAALLMFQFLKYREKQKEVHKTARLFTKLKKEYENNYSVLIDLGGEIANGSTELARLLKENQKVRDLFVLAVYRLDFIMYDTYYHDTDWQIIRDVDSYSESYLELFEQSNQVEYLCQAIVENKINSEESLKQLLVLITEKIGTMQQHQLDIELRERPIETDSECEYETEPAGVKIVQE
ncbi:hypothetical protein [Enterococcus malodoratus]|uniref:hypothetical protein n=1 Tax=Enterococcus malodoratus TaxID=71451 RepID=UPI0039AEC274